jgi:hypothetical protein
LRRTSLQADAIERERLAGDDPSAIDARSMPNRPAHCGAAQWMAARAATPGQRVDIVRRHEDAGLAGMNRLAATRDIGGDQRPAAGAASSNAFGALATGRR